MSETKNRRTGLSYEDEMAWEKRQKEIKLEKTLKKKGRNKFYNEMIKNIAAMDSEIIRESYISEDSSEDEEYEDEEYENEEYKEKIAEEDRDGFGFYIKEDDDNDNHRIEYDDTVEKSPKVKIIENRCRTLLEEIIDDYGENPYLWNKFSNELLRSNSLKAWQKFENSIIKYIRDEIGIDGLITNDSNKKAIDYLKRKAKKDSFDLGKEKIEQKTSKDKSVIDKAIQNKLSQKD
ncbi:MAG: hypothetical protein IJ638_02275 [Alphaproteobacteria bacterium]|nr:hypothetical protein [Alphaproteobacteria bacterium]